MNPPTALLPRERRQSHCPTCGIARGEPMMNTVGGGLQTLLLHCPHCGHEWRMEITRESHPVKVEGDSHADAKRA